MQASRDMYADGGKHNEKTPQSVPDASQLRRHGGHGREVHWPALFGLA